MPDVLGSLGAHRVFALLVPETAQNFAILANQVTATGNIEVSAAVEVLDDLELSYGVPLELVPVAPEELAEGIRRSFSAGETVIELVRDLEGAMEGP